MALSLDTTYKNLPVPGAYIVVVCPTVSEDKGSITFNVRTSAIPDSEALTAEYYTAPYDLEGENPIKQAYVYLKTLPEFSDATDC